MNNINDALLKYENMTPEEIQKEIVPIIKSYSKDYIATKLNISKECLYTYCKKVFINKNKKPRFDIYIRLVSLGVNDGTYEKQKHGRKGFSIEEKEKRIKKYEEEIAQRKKDRHEKSVLHNKEYQHRYYMEVTKKKRELEKKQRKSI